jgi:membrane-bound serine protease (ClpP class)
LSWGFVGTAAAMIFGLIAFVSRGLMAARRRPSRIGAQAMRGLSAEIVDWRRGAGHVLVRGERWQAQSEEAFTKGEIVEVTTSKGLTLLVRRPQGFTASNGEFR